MDRRTFLVLAAGMALLPKLFSGQSGDAVAKDVDIHAILRDPDTPVAGNLDGDVIVAAFSDYNCPFCKAAARDLDKFVRDDGKVRLAFKDWPILTNASFYGARLALAAKYQGKYELVHDALMAVPGAGVSQGQMLEAVQTSGVDMTTLLADLAKRAEDIEALLARNAAEARRLGLEGTPAYLIGNRLYNTLDYSGFRRAVADTRRAPEGSS